jgi:hypothetical protein
LKQTALKQSIKTYALYTVVLKEKLKKKLEAEN